MKKLVSNTPLVKIKVKIDGKVKNIYAKCEWYSLTGSIKDKVAYQIFYDLITNKKVSSGDKIVEVTSGNMGLSLSACGNLLGVKVAVLLPKNMSEERKKLLRLYGALLVEVEDFMFAFKLCKEYEKKVYIATKQFENKANKKAHFEITGKEIEEKIKDENVKNFVSGVGTGGTLVGVGERLKRLGIKTYALEPMEARILSNKKPFKKHQLQGLADEIVPKLYDKKLVTDILQVQDNDAIAMSQKLCKELSLPVGISGGANFLASCMLENDTVTIFPDDNKKYLSTNLSNVTHSDIVDKIELLDIKVI